MSTLTNTYEQPPAKRPVRAALFSLVLTLGWASAAATDAAPFVFRLENAPGERVSGVLSAEDGGLGRPYLVCDEQTPGVDLELDAPVTGDFAVSAWVRLDKDPTDGDFVFSDTTPGTIVHLKGDTEAILRVAGRRLQFTMDGRASWKGVTSHGELPMRQWVLVTASWSRGEMTLYINGSIQATRAYQQVSPHFTELTIGRTHNRRFLGGIDEVRIEDGPANLADLARTVERREGVVATPPSWRPEVASPPYRYLKAAADAVHPIAEGLSTNVEAVAWSGDDRVELLIGSEPHFYGARQGVLKPTGARDPSGLPVYGPLDPVALVGTNFKRLSREAGSFDLLATAAGTPLGSGWLIHYRNLGEPGHPRFGQPEAALVDGGSLARALPAAPGPWTLHDLNGDGVQDLIATAGTGMGQEYWPDGISMWSGSEEENSGPGRGYDIDGNWLGRRGVTKMFWAPGLATDGDGVAFGTPRPVRVGDREFQLQWRFYSPSMVPTVAEIDGRDWLVVVGDVDRVLAMPIECRGDRVSVGPAQPLLEGAASLQDMYWANSITPADLDSDGADELVVSGNPGRVVVLKGDKVGRFVEAGSLSMEGGPVAVDTLVTPTRGDWDGDEWPDLVCGDASGRLTYWPGTPDPLVYAAPQPLRMKGGDELHHQAGPTGSIQGPNERRWGYTQPAMGDWDLDGVADLVVNDITATITLYKRAGDPGEVTAETFTLNGQPLPAAWRARPIVMAPEQLGRGERPELLYLDWDGDLSLGLPEKVGSTNLVETNKILYDDGEPVRLSGIRGHWGRAKLSVADWDRDGRWDLVWGQNAGVNRYIWQEAPPRGATVCWLKNVGTNRAPVFERLRTIGLASGDSLDFKVHNSSVWPTDLNGDGELDLLVGAEDGKVYYFFHSELEPPTTEETK